MFNTNIIYNFVNFGIKTWLKSICKSIDIKDLKLILNKKEFGKLDEIYLEARNLIYQGLFINKIIIKIYNCNLKFNFKNHLIYSEDLNINSFLTINSRNLENIFFSKHWKEFRKKIEKTFLENQITTSLLINNEFITFTYDRNKIKKQIDLLLKSKENYIFLEQINNKKKLYLPLDKNIKLKSCLIKNDLININLLSKVIFDN